MQLPLPLVGLEKTAAKEREKIEATCVAPCVLDMVDDLILGTWADYTWIHTIAMCASSSFFCLWLGTLQHFYSSLRFFCFFSLLFYALHTSSTRLWPHGQLFDLTEVANLAKSLLVSFLLVFFVRSSEERNVTTIKCCKEKMCLSHFCSLFFVLSCVKCKVWVDCVTVLLLFPLILVCT